MCRTKRVRVWMRRVWREHGGTSRGRQCTRRQTRDVRRRARAQRSAVRLAELVSRAAAFGTLTLTIYQCAGSSNTHPCFAHASATNIIERWSQTYARLFQATALRPSDNTAKDARIFAQTLYQHPTVSLSFPHNQPTPILKTTAFSHFSMTDQSVSSRFRTLFELALEDYEIKTKISLEKHPLARKLENCHSVESITTLLQEQARTFGEPRGKDRITKSIRSTVTFLSKLSATGALGDDLGLVRQKTLMTGFNASDIVLQAFPPARALHTGLGVLLTVCAFLRLLVRT